MSYALEVVRTLVLVAFLLLTLAFVGPVVTVDAMVLPYRTCEVTVPSSDQAVLVRRSIITGATRWQVPDLPNLYPDAGRWLASGEITKANRFPAEGYRGGYRERLTGTVFEIGGFNDGPFDLYAMAVEVDHTSGEPGYYTAGPESFLLSSEIPQALLAPLEALTGTSLAPRIRAGTYGTLVTGPVDPDAADRIEEVDDRTWSWSSTEYLVSYEIPSYVCR